MSSSDERVEALAAFLARHHIEIEHRAYPTFACAFEDWNGAEGDNGGDTDGIHDTRYGHGLHLARALLDSPAMRDLLAEAWDEGYNGGFQNGAEAARREPVSRANNTHSRAAGQVDASWCCCDVMPMRDCAVHGEEADR